MEEPTEGKREHERSVDAMVDAMVDAAALLPGNNGYYTFEGSLTTPPCSQDVRWFVLKTPVRMTAGEIAAFGKLDAMNARPTQPLKGA